MSTPCAPGVPNSQNVLAQTTRLHVVYTLPSSLDLQSTIVGASASLANCSVQTRRSGRRRHGCVTCPFPTAATLHPGECGAGRCALNVAYGLAAQIKAHELRSKSKTELNSQVSAMQPGCYNLL